jgi:hypothetical protein
MADRSWFAQTKERRFECWVQSSRNFANEDIIEGKGIT